MWECGLKQTYGNSIIVPDTVTPYVGVWIETRRVRAYREARPSLLMWECGLKPRCGFLRRAKAYVTPYVGVWIETSEAGGIHR